MALAYPGPAADHDHISSPNRSVGLQAGPGDLLPRRIRPNPAHPSVAGPDGPELRRQVDLLATPVSPGTAWAFGAKADPLAMYLADIYTVTADLAGIPGISVPCGETREKLPIGLQILGKHFDEATILRVAHAYEQAA